MPYFSGDSEGEALDDMLEDGGSNTEDLRAATAIIAKQHTLKLYETAAAAKVGTECHCPGCGKKFKKKSYQQKFCSNKGRGNCKDTYWNRADDSRMQRAAYFSR